MFTCWMHSSLQLHKADLNLPTISNLCHSYYRSLFLQSSGFQVSPFSPPYFPPFPLKPGCIDADVGAPRRPPWHNLDDRPVGTAQHRRWDQWLPERRHPPRGVVGKSMVENPDEKITAWKTTYEPRNADRKKNKPFVPDENTYFRLQNIDGYVFSPSKANLVLRQTDVGAQDISGLRVDPSQWMIVMWEVHRPLIYPN